MYISVSEASKKYNKAEKTIRRLYENKTLSRSQAYKSKKNKWKLNTEWLDTLWLDTVPVQTPDNDQPEADKKTSQTDSDTMQVLNATLQTLQQQLAVKDEQLAKLDKKLDQQQALTAGMQNQLIELNKMIAISAPQEADIQAKTTKTRPATKKAVKPAQNGSKKQSNNKKPAKERWWNKKLF